MKTNLETVRHLQALEGANNMASFPIPMNKKWAAVNGQLQVKILKLMNVSNNNKLYTVYIAPFNASQWSIQYKERGT